MQLHAEQPLDARRVMGAATAGRAAASAPRARSRKSLGSGVTADVKLWGSERGLRACSGKAWAWHWQKRGTAVLLTEVLNPESWGLLPAQPVPCGTVVAGQPVASLPTCKMGAKLCLPILTGWRGTDLNGSKIAWNGMI